MKISAILAAMLLTLSLQVTPVFAHSDEDSSDKDSYEHAYNKDKDAREHDGSKDRGRERHGGSHRDAGQSEGAGNGHASDSFLPDWWPF